MAQSPINEDKHINETHDLFMNENKISIEERSANEMFKQKKKWKPCHKIILTWLFFMCDS
jgi:hypothetical protein